MQVVMPLEIEVSRKTGPSGMHLSAQSLVRDPAAVTVWLWSSWCDWLLA